MLKSYMRLFAVLLIASIVAGCRDEVLPLPDDAEREGGLPVEFFIDIDDCDGTRGILSESKQEFANSELVHVRAVFDCESKDGAPRQDVIYTILQCSSNSYSGGRYNIQWSVLSGQPALMWPDDAVSGSFTAYYIAGSSGALSSNQMEAKLLSEYKASEVPLSAEINDVAYGEAVRLPMKRLFSFLTLTEMLEGISDDLWFTVHNDDMFNNAFQLYFDAETKEMIPTFCQIPSNEYKDDNGNPLVFVRSYDSETPEGTGSDDGSAAGISFFLEPRAYHQFSILYPRSRSEYATYLTYTKDLAQILESEENPRGEFQPNGRYVFSILKSLGVIVEESPDDGWDEAEPTIEINVEKFLKAIQSGDSYSEYDEKSGQEVQILESTSDGTRLLRNVSFQHTYYDVLPGNFRPTLSSTFDGNYHYIYDMCCPLFYENYGNIINLGIRDAETKDADGNERPLISSEKAERNGTTVDMSYNGIIASRNMGVVDNVRVVNVEMTVQIQAVGAGEAHNVSLLFGVNQGRIYDVGLAGELKLAVENAPGDNVMPQVMVGGITAQNTGTIRGISYIEDEKENFSMPQIIIENNCQGETGAYWTGGVAGTNIGNLEDIFLPSVIVNAYGSEGVGSYIGGMVGENQSSNSGAPTITGCIVRGSVDSGLIKSLTNITSYSYTGGVAGAWNVQASIDNCSISVDVTDIRTKDAAAEYGQGGAFGIIQPIPAGSGLQEGEIKILSCFGSVLNGNGYVGNFAGIVPAGYGWEHYKENQINIKQHDGIENIGMERTN